MDDQEEEARSLTRKGPHEKIRGMTLKGTYKLEN